ncbi:MAG: tripartite tricarboxylate transporter substrate binding protein, partial [Rhodospirillales bacterium]|nr:tripartite tricarboxylate transporter substrate binding protein [Acetobacter sp.]
WAPAGTPRDVLDSLTSAWQKVADTPEVRSRLAAVSAVPVGSTAQALDELTRSESRLWGEVVKARKIAPVQ